MGQDLEPTACEIKVDGSNQNVKAYSTNSGGGPWVTLWGKGEVRFLSNVTCHSKL